MLAPGFEPWTSFVRTSALTTLKKATFSVFLYRMIKRSNNLPKLKWRHCVTAREIHEFPAGKCTGSAESKIEPRLACMQASKRSRLPYPVTSFWDTPPTWINFQLQLKCSTVLLLKCTITDTYKYISRTSYRVWNFIGLEIPVCISNDWFRVRLT